MARQAERRARTRTSLIDAASDHFVRHGYAATSLDDIVAAMGVSKGALYHHFASKTALLEAVFDHVSRATIARAVDAARTDDSPRGALARALKAWLRAVLAEQPRAILLEIGPAVLGFARARAIENAISEQLVAAAIERAVATGDGRCANPRLAARLLNAAVAELALTAIEDDDAGGTLDDAERHIDLLVDALVPARSA